MSKKSPKVVDLINALSTLKRQQGLTYLELIDLLNKHLPEERKILSNSQGITQLERWMKPNRNRWSEPSGEIILAIQEVNKSKTVNPLVNEI